jgi:hypothetical protein
MNTGGATDSLKITHDVEKKSVEIEGPIKPHLD